MAHKTSWADGLLEKPTPSKAALAVAISGMHEARLIGWGDPHAQG